jgi:amino acid adenylation domain-containing protein
VKHFSSAPQSLVELLRYRATVQAHQLAYIFLSDGEETEIALTYAELDGKAQALARQLQALEMQGERALLLYPSGLDYIVAFFGCLYSGVIAVPSYPPQTAKLNRALVQRLLTIIKDAQPKVILTTTHYRSVLENLVQIASEFRQMHWFFSDQLPSTELASWKDPAIERTTLAFLQYTSGSTSTPKGVMLTHGNLLHNSMLIERYFGHSSESFGMSWLPPYHDMGLIGGILQPLYCGFPVVLMSPVAFIQRPLRWLKAISRYGVTTSGGPNFAYELCLRKITPEQRDQLDLNSWRVAFSGAEPIRADVLQRFADFFSPAGFRAEAFYPCYGLAEATLIVSGGEVTASPVTQRYYQQDIQQSKAVAYREGEGQSKAVELVGCGQTAPDQRICIVYPESKKRLEEGEIGEIWIQGPSVAQGYWQKEEETERTFRASLADDGAGPFLRTGDLGFLDHGELFITGRLKDLIIIRGRNYYPQDIELGVWQCHPALRADGGAAFVVESGDEVRLCIVQEVERHALTHDSTELVAMIRQAIAESQQLAAYAVVLIKPGRLPKTSSGKVQRRLCRDMYLDGQFEKTGSVIFSDALAQELVDTRETFGTDIKREDLLALDQDTRQQIVGQYLREVVASLLHLSPTQVSLESHLTALGLDSLAAVELQHELETHFAVELPMATLLQDVTIHSITNKILRMIVSAHEESSLSIKVQEVESVKRVRYPLSDGQRALWFLHQLAPESAAYHITGFFQVRAPFDPEIFGRALDKLLQRHAILRTRISVGEEGPQQDIDLRSDHISITKVDARLWSRDECERYLLQYAQVPFRMQEDPLLRVALLHCAEDGYLLAMVVHHILVDYWSLVLLVNELKALYVAEVEQREPNLPPLLASYADFVSWQQALMESAAGEAHLAYWLQQLSDELPILHLPLDHPRPAIQTYHGAAETFVLTAEVVEQLQMIARAEQATLYMVLLAAFHVLLYRYSGQEDCLIGTPTVGRSSARFARTIGYFVNLVCMRANLTGNPSFRVFLQQIRQTVLEALAHQDCPFPLLVERLLPARDPGITPLFQVMFALDKSHLTNTQSSLLLAQDAQAKTQTGEMLTLDILPLQLPTAQFDLALMMEEVGNTITASLQYNTDLFEAQTIWRMVSHFQAIVREIISSLSTPIEAIPLLSSEEYEVIVHGWNQHQHAVRPVGLHHLFEEQAHRTPQAVALYSGTQTLSYGELEEAATRLAGRLRRRGVGPEQLVGIYLEREPALVIALLAVLKAGGAYVPLDPHYPRERTRQVVTDAQLRALVTTSGLLAEVPLEGPHILLMDQQEEAAEQEERVLPAFVSIEQLAYVIYTSGSTGQPKGVSITHRSAVTFIEWALEIFPQEQLQGVLASTSICFDLSIFELFAPLSCGGAIILAENALHLPALPAAQRVTLMNTVPSAMQELLRLQAIPPSVQTINLAGEPLSLQLAQQVYGCEQVEALYNLYGPTEDTTYSTVSLIDRGASEAPPIGRVLSESQAYVLDRWGQPVPIGVMGELYLGGQGLARGYLRRAGLTAERFVPDPFSGQVGARLYRTGDLVRAQADGTLQFLGRADEQIKLRGFRIELGEIQAVLKSLPGVAEALVVAQEHRKGERELVGYWIATAEMAGQEKEQIRRVRQGLQERLPGYMVPASLVQVEQWPLTPNGKIDRQRLPIPEPDQSEALVGMAPQTETEKQVALLWAEVLGKPITDRTANFFALGGHSLLATQVVARIRERFQIEFPLRTLFEISPTIAVIAAYIDHVRIEEAKVSTLPRIQPRRQRSL